MSCLKVQGKFQWGGRFGLAQQHHELILYHCVIRDTETQTDA